ncbi:hypothetical protein F5148DRAFT_1292283 [Russula earlei]|uniref:Uncharacterized protein n=1 Tax=Russula earlei TaxID=71964 RepID=A0ACC0TTP3_9AGAM|nr:hypothetical protein F5148DRAFT_1292283 [Russula earlei]
MAGNLITRVRESSTPPPPTPPPQGPLSFKPKVHTSLHHTTFDLLSIRVNPKLTQSKIQPISMLVTAEHYLLMCLCTRLPSMARLLHDAGSGTGKGRCEGKVFVFNNGSFVCCGLSQEDAMQFRRDVLSPAKAEIGSFTEPEVEELEFATDPSQKTQLQGDLIILRDGPQPPHPENLLDLCRPLSCSTALSALQASLEDYLSSMSSLPLALEKTGKLGMSRCALVKKLGELLRFRLQSSGHDQELMRGFVTVLQLSNRPVVVGDWGHPHLTLACNQHQLLQCINIYLLI